MSKKVTVTKRFIDELKSSLDRKEVELAKVKADRDKFRRYFLSLLKQNISMASKNQYYSAESMINQLSKLMNEVEDWWWV